MKRSIDNMITAIFSTQNMSKVFYLLALVPLILMAYSYYQNPLGLVIPLYAFIILLLKKDKLFSHPKAGISQRLFGIIVIITSFLAYYVVSPFLAQAAFYGFANYSLYIIGLFLAFFHIRALKEAFSPLFLVAAFLASSVVSSLAKPIVSPFIPQLATFITRILGVLGITATYSTVASMLDWACVGFATIYIFSVILIVIMSEEPSNIKTRVFWSAIGVLGAVSIAIIRLVAIFAGFYSFGFEIGQMIHLYAGYVLFIAWSVIFLYSFSKRNVILQKMKRLYARWKPNTTTNENQQAI